MAVENVSKKMTVLSFCAMISVVLIHSTSCLTVEHPARWNLLCQYLVTRSFTYWAVPFFFAMSGFWFTKGGYMQGREGLMAFFGKKVRTLLVPYLLWAVIGALLVTPCVVGNNFLTHRGLLERTFLSDGTVWNAVCSVFALDRILPAGNGPLWYVRSLLILFVAAPFWHVCYRTRWGAWLLSGIWLGETLFYPHGIHSIELPSMALGWFAFGILAAKFHWEDCLVPGRLWTFAGLIWLATSVFKAVHVAGFIVISPVVYGKMLLLIPYGGIVFFWGLYDRIGKEWRFPQWMRATFWVYCFHSIPLCYLMAGMKGVLGKSDGVSVLTMFAAIVSVPVVCYGASGFIKRIVPRTYAVLTGGRA